MVTIQHSLKNNSAFFKKTMIEFYHGKASVFKTQYNKAALKNDFFLKYINSPGKVKKLKHH